MINYNTPDAQDIRDGQGAQNTYTRPKFIKILNRDVNVSSINSIFLNKEGKEIVFSLNHISTTSRGQDISSLLHYYLDDNSYSLAGKELLNIISEYPNFLIPISTENNRLDIINLDNVSYIKYNSEKLQITFNFKNSIFKNGVWVSDFIHWKFSSVNEYNIEITNLDKVKNI